MTVALPSSLTREVPHLREKTSKAGMIARALGIYRVERVVIYNDDSEGGSSDNGSLLQKLLSFQETPQYLRKSIFGQQADFQFTGILPPLRLPSHPSVEDPRPGLIREALVVESGETSRVNAGFKDTIKLPTRLKLKQRVTIKLVKTKPSLEGELIDANRLPIYWGFSITRTDSKLNQVIKGENPDLTISTSRKGRPFQAVSTELGIRWKTSRRPLVLFGSPSEGIPDILEKEGIRVDTVSDYNLNTIPHQGVETVRTEEALHATLACLSQLGDS